ncbi:MAG: Fic family protein [Deltaproteobacteria bacterium]|nr:Fic family protein [Deltaproteobacteria bacterium]
MLFRIPRLGREEQRALERIRELWTQLAWQLRSEPYRWTGLLRRTSFARALQGSNSIEGIEVSPEDALAAADGAQPFEAANEAWAAVSGYRDAMTYVLQLAADPHFRYEPSLLRSLHFMMLRYNLAKKPGAWRPGAIYVRDDRSGDIVYEGPDAEEVPALMGELARELNAETSDSPMIRAALAHLNLVMIHPFSDGNGRMARCLQTLVLARAGVLDSTFGSIEEDLGRNTESYYAVLAEVGGGAYQPKRNARPWVRFVLAAHFRQATTTLRRNRELGAVWGDVELEVQRRGLPERCIVLLVNAAQGYPIRNADYRRHADVSGLVASRDLRALTSAGLLRAEGEKRGRRYRASEELRAIRAKHRRREAMPDPFAAR